VAAEHSLAATRHRRRDRLHVLLIGVAMIVCRDRRCRDSARPGDPATEFVWARRVLKKAKGYFEKGQEKLQKGKGKIAD
jgi:hypothetical protein